MECVITYNIHFLCYDYYLVDMSKYFDTIKYIDTYFWFKVCYHGIGSGFLFR